MNARLTVRFWSFCTATTTRDWSAGTSPTVWITSPGKKVSRKRVFASPTTLTEPGAPMAFRDPGPARGVRPVFGSTLPACPMRMAVASFGARNST